MVPFDKEGSFSNQLMLYNKKALVDLSKDPNGPESPDDTFKFLLPWGFFHTDYLR